MAQKKWFTKGEQVVSSTIASDHVQYLYEGYTEHDTKAAAEATAGGDGGSTEVDQAAADKAAADAAAADRSSADTAGKPSPPAGSKPKS